MITGIKRYANVLREREARGQTMTEYALILAAVAIVAIVGYLALGTAVTTLINNVVKCL
jgi:Flp pilus assembly pilin Flp